MSVLQPISDKGEIAVVSGQMGMDKVGTLRWDGAVAQARMDNLLSAFYTDKKVQGVLAPYDGLSRGIISSLKGVGYGTADQPMPIVTGQDAELASVKGMIAGEQYSTVFKGHARACQRSRPRWSTPCCRARIRRSTTPRPTTMV